MKALVQRVSKASVEVNSEVINSIESGLLVFLGVTHTDKPETADKLSKKIASLRIFDDDDGKMNNCISDTQEILCISQFTLYGDVSRGNRPSYTEAAHPRSAEPLYLRVCENLGAKLGVFGASMKVELINDGPVTLMLEIDE